MMFVGGFGCCSVLTYIVKGRVVLGRLTSCFLGLLVHVGVCSLVGCLYRTLVLARLCGVHGSCLFGVFVIAFLTVVQRETSVFQFEPRC
ncbi:hypothetical protein BDV28DRAFT_126009 [Aspergillus coremiiformis]|uniref:Uncharacterized protein n=1 Tax=Aspergillus coremiiformis TaxID=138285 RepID=A0A5N6ZJ44_9EURO|nr:hypothetical protein BDV28DRAFT_126009 [Aspergillus coremiiformis]